MGFEDEAGLALARGELLLHPLPDCLTMIGVGPVGRFQVGSVPRGELQLVVDVLRHLLAEGSARIAVGNNCIEGKPSDHEQAEVSPRL